MVKRCEHRSKKIDNLKENVLDYFREQGLVVSFSLEDLNLNDLQRAKSVKSNTLNPHLGENEKFSSRPAQVV
jgi:hypothetical protein